MSALSIVGVVVVHQAEQRRALTMISEMEAELQAKGNQEEEIARLRVCGIRQRCLDMARLRVPDTGQHYLRDGTAQGTRHRPTLPRHGTAQVPDTGRHCTAPPTVTAQSPCSHCTVCPHVRTHVYACPNTCLNGRPSSRRRMRCWRRPITTQAITIKAITSQAITM